MQRSPASLFSPPEEPPTAFRSTPFRNPSVPAQGIWNVESISGPPAPTPLLWKSFRAEEIVGRGRDGLVILVRSRAPEGSHALYVAKIAVFRRSQNAPPAPPLKILNSAEQAAPPKSRTDFYDDAVYAATRLDPWQVPLVMGRTPLIELHNWVVVQHALRPNVGVGNPRAPNYSNIARLTSWEHTHWRHRDSQELVAPMRDQRKDRELADRISAELARLADAQNPVPFNQIDVEVQILYIENVKGGSLSLQTDPNNNTIRNYEHYLDAKRFFDLWTQIACTMAFLQKRVNASHGDLHPGNVMIELASAAFPPAARDDTRPLVLSYDLPIIDQRGRVFDWKFFVVNPTHVVRIIDFGRSRTQLKYPEDLRDAPADNQAVDGHAWAQSFPDYYAQRGDLFSFAMAAFGEISQVLARPQYRSSDHARSVFAIGRLLLHALERVPYSNSVRPLAKDIAERWDLRSLVNQDDAARLGQALSAIVRSRNEASYHCVEHRARSEECPQPPQNMVMNPATDPGRWSIDEHLVLFARELNGYPRATGFEPYTWTRSRVVERLLQDPRPFRIVDMLPSADRRPPEFPREAQHSSSYPAEVPYPVFRGKELGYESLDEPLRVYRIELSSAATVM